MARASAIMRVFDATCRLFDDTYERYKELYKVTYGHVGAGMFEVSDHLRNAFDHHAMASTIARDIELAHPKGDYTDREFRNAILHVERSRRHILAAKWYCYAYMNRALAKKVHPIIGAISEYAPKQGAEYLEALRKLSAKEDAMEASARLPGERQETLRGLQKDMAVIEEETNRLRKLRGRFSDLGIKTEKRRRELIGKAGGN